MMRSTMRPLLLGACASLIAGSAAAAPQIEISREIDLRLTIHPITVERVGGAEPLQLDLPANRPAASLRFAVGWPTSEARSTVELVAQRQATETASVRLVATVLGEQEALIQTTRSFPLQDRSTNLFEIARSGERSLTIAVGIALSERTVVKQGAPSGGQPLVLQLEVRSVEGEQSRLLETNRLSTLVGEPVTYSFQHGGDQSKESVSVTLRPVRLVDQIVEIEVQLAGALPDDDGARWTHRRERWVTTSGATSSIDFTSGDPPIGYRFRVTPTY